MTLAPIWSFKKYKMYKLCPLWLKLKYIEQLPEPPPNEKSDAARLRGIKIHEEMEACIKGTGPIPSYAQSFEPIICQLVERKATAEEQMFLNAQWQAHSGWEGHWLQVTQDVLVVDDEFVLTGDWKSGKRYGNEYWHFKQMQLYSIAAWRVFPGRPLYTNELYYLDKSDCWTIDFTPAQLEKALGDFDREVDIMFSDKTFRPKPNVDTCRFCPYNNKGTGACPVAAC